jgi:hypothetical protein
VSVLTVVLLLALPVIKLQCSLFRLDHMFLYGIIVIIVFLFLSVILLILLLL